MEVADLGKRRGLVAVADVKVLDLEPQPVWIESYFVDGDRALERPRDLSREHVAQDGRNAEKAEQSEDDDYTSDGDADPADAARGAPPLNRACGPDPKTPERLPEHSHRRSQYL